jgi:hypothetical protein
MTERQYLERISISFTPTEKDEDIFRFIKSFSSLQKTVDFIFTWRYTLESLGITVSLDESKIPTYSISSEYKIWLKKNKAKKIVYIQDNNSILYDYLVRIKKKKFLTIYFKESVRLYLYGKTNTGKILESSIPSLDNTSILENKLDILSEKLDKMINLNIDTAIEENPSSTPSVDPQKRQAAKDIFRDMTR